MSGLMMARSRPVPIKPPLEKRVQTNYERFDGFDSTPYPADLVSDDAANPYGDRNPRPGQNGTHGNTPYGDIGRLGPNARGIPGVVGSVGAAPRPGADCLKKTSADFVSSLTTAQATQSNPNYRFGPGGQFQGIAQTAAMSEITNNPPQPGDLASIIAGSA